jgi:hypothetical protein
MPTNSRTPRDAMMTAMTAAALTMEGVLLGGCGGTQVAVGAGDGEPIAVAERPEARTYAFWQKDLFITDMAAELELLSSDFDRLFPVVEHAGGFVQSKAIPAIEKLRGLSAVLCRQLEEAKTASAQDWPALTSRFAKGLKELKGGLEHYRQKITGSVSK